MALKNKIRTVSVEVNVGYVDVEIDLSNIGTDDLVAELESRGNYSHITSVDIEDIYKQFSFGNEARAVELTKKYIENNIGRVIA